MIMEEHVNCNGVDRRVAQKAAWKEKANSPAGVCTARRIGTTELLLCLLMRSDDAKGNRTHQTVSNRPIAVGKICCDEECAKTDDSPNQ